MHTKPTARTPKIDDEIRELAYGLWADACHRSPARVSAKLAERGHSVAPGVISNWVERHRWAERIEAELNTYEPGIRRVTAFRLIGNADLASRIEADYLQRYLDDGTVPDKTVVVMVEKALAHGGFSPVGSRDPIALPAEGKKSSGPSALMQRYFPDGLLEAVA